MKDLAVDDDYLHLTIAAAALDKVGRALDEIALAGAIALTRTVRSRDVEV